MDGLEQEYGDRVAFQRLDFNTPQNRAPAGRYRVNAHPAIVIIRPDGTTAATIVGVPERAQIAAALEQALAPE